MLHKIDTKGWGKNTAWCVPTAVSFLCGSPLIHSHSRAAWIRNEKLKDVSGVMSGEALLMLREQGYKAVPLELKEKYSECPKLLSFMKNLLPIEKVFPLMICIEGKGNFSHMIVSHFGYMADNWTMKPVEQKDFPHMSKYVVSAWQVTKI